MFNSVSIWGVYRCGNELLGQGRIRLPKEPIVSAGMELLRESEEPPFVAAFIEWFCLP